MASLQSWYSGRKWNNLKGVQSTWMLEGLLVVVSRVWACVNESICEMRVVKSRMDN